MSGFATTLKYWDLPKGSFIDLGFNDDEYVHVRCERMTGCCFFSIKLNSKAMKLIKEKVYSVTFLGISKSKPYTGDFRFDFHYPDLVKILELIEKDD